MSAASPVPMPPRRLLRHPLGLVALGLGSGALVCVPVPEDVALPEDVARGAIGRAVAEAETNGIVGPAVTPWLLARIAEITAGRSVRANTALIENDARVAARLAAALLEG